MEIKTVADLDIKRLYDDNRTKGVWIAVQKAKEKYCTNSFPGQIKMIADIDNGPEYGRPLNGAGVLRISQKAKIRFGI